MEKEGEEEGEREQGMYRSAASTIGTRYKKKLLEKVNWYRKRKRYGGNEDEEEKGRAGKKREKREIAEGVEMKPLP